MQRQTSTGQTPTRRTLICQLLPRLMGAVGVTGCLLGLACPSSDPPPPRPPPPAAAPATPPAERRRSAALYRALLEQDAKGLGVPIPVAAAWAAPFPYFDELPRKRHLRGGETLRTGHLSLSLQVRRIEGAVEGQSFRADHLVLKIENPTGHYLAYRVITEVPNAARCEAKGIVDHDAIALRPHETIARSECLLQKGGGVTLARVEVLEIPALSYYYVSRLDPALVLYDPRTAAGHTVPRSTACPQTFSWRDIRDGAERGEIAWRDILDFYARHNCDEYAFYPGYRYRADAALPLPARAPLGAP